MGQVQETRRQRIFNNFGSKLAQYGLGLSPRAKCAPMMDLMEAAFDVFSDDSVGDDAFEEGCRLYLEIAAMRRVDVELGEYGPSEVS